VDAPFLLQGRGKEGDDLVSLRGWVISSELAEEGPGLLATSSEAARERPGWLNFLGRRKKGILKGEDQDKRRP
jgi:hypothetical protein